MGRALSGDPVQTQINDQCSSEIGVASEIQCDNIVCRKVNEPSGALPACSFVTEI